jgi:long-chain fatty acid transport protein
MNTNYQPITSVFSNGPRTGVDLSQLFISPTISYKLNQNHAIGASLNLAYQRFKASGIGNFGPYSSSSGDLTDRGYDDSTGMGVRLGWTGNISPYITLGATWQSETKMSRFDKYKGLFAEQGDFDIPANFGVGAAFKVTPALTAAVDFVRIQYSNVKSINNPISALAMGTLGNSGGAGFGWNDQIVYKIGLSYEHSKDLTLRAGWNHGDVPFNSTETAFNILAPAVVEDHVTLGATWTLANKAEVTVAYMHAFEGSMSSGGVAAGSGTVNNLKMYQDSLGVSYGMKF